MPAWYSFGGNLKRFWNFPGKTLRFDWCRQARGGNESTRGADGNKPSLDLSLQTNLRDGDYGNKRAVQRDISNYGLRLQRLRFR